jgi:hypothetical protein
MIGLSSGVCTFDVGIVDQVVKDENTDVFFLKRESFDTSVSAWSYRV